MKAHDYRFDATLTRTPAYEKQHGKLPNDHLLWTCIHCMKQVALPKEVEPMNTWGCGEEAGNEVVLRRG